MKNVAAPNVNQQQVKSKQQRPENKDNLDSRSNEEQDFKGEDLTNNKKVTKEEKIKKNHSN